MRRRLSRREFAKAGIAAAAASAIDAFSLDDTAQAQQAAQNTERPTKKMQKLTAVPFTQVEIRDRFWSPRRETNRKVSLSHSLDMLEKAGNIRNLELAAQGAREGFVGGFVFQDSDLYKVIEAVSYSLATDPDPVLEQRVDGIIARIAAAQMPDGYLNTWYQIKTPDRRWTNLRDDHELYCAGHLFEAAVAHYQATGKRNLLDVATKFADHIAARFGDGPGQRPGYPGHPEIELALIKLWRVTGEKRYFDVARYFVTTRGNRFFAKEHSTPPERYTGEYWQDNCPITEHSAIVGHAVRAAYLFSGVVDIAGETGDADLLKMIDRVWKNTTQKRMYVTGGIGPSAHNEGFTTDYDLPNLTAYQETCASVAMAMWNHRLNLLYGDSRYADLVELSLYNGALAGVSLDGKRFFYVNPLESRGTHHRSEWFGCACCPPNIARTLSALGGYAYAASKDSLYVNLYIQGRAKADVGGKPVSLEVTTDYPWDGTVKMTVRPDAERQFALRLRKPGWCAGESVRVNGRAVSNPPTEQGYLVLSRTWKPGDTVELRLPMPVRRVEANPRVEADRGQLAIARGPLIYCLEQADNSAPLMQTAIPADATLKASPFAPELLGGIVPLKGEGIVATEPDWGEERVLYRAAQPPQKVSVTAIPYYAWDHRTPGAMRVWMPTTPPPPVVGALERSAQVSLSFRSGNSQPWGINDGMEPKSSGEQPAALCHWWPHKGGTEWAQYDWKKPVRIERARVYWFDDTGRGECRLPVAWRILYKDGGNWKPVAAQGEYAVKPDAWCEVRFSPVATTALRLEVEMQPRWAAGVHEWQVFAPDED